MASGLAAHMGRLQISVRDTPSVTATVPDDPIALLMYYFHVCLDGA